MDLVTGGAGFLGSHLVDRLLAQGREVRVLDAFVGTPDDPAARREANAAAWRGVDVVRADVRDEMAVAKALDGVDRVFHLAALTGVRGARPLEHYRAVNRDGTAALLATMRRKGVRRLVFTSSSSVYGATRGEASRETDAPRPVSPYAVSKVEAERLVLDAIARGDVDAAIVRPFTVYGPRQRHDMAVLQFLGAVADGRPVVVHGDGTSTRDHTFVGDVVAAILAAAEAGPNDPPIANAGAGRPVALAELVDAVARTVGRAAIVERRPDQPGDVPHTHADLARARAWLGWSPAVPLDEGLARTWTWLRRG